MSDVYAPSDAEIVAFLAENAGTRAGVVERMRQVAREWYYADDDDRGGRNTLTAAAVCYAVRCEATLEEKAIAPEVWPWRADAWKPGTPIRMLVKAHALLAAELDRRFRAGERP